MASNTARPSADDGRKLRKPNVSRSANGKTPRPQCDTAKLPSLMSLPTAMRATISRQPNTNRAMGVRDEVVGVHGSRQPDRPSELARSVRTRRGLSGNDAGATGSGFVRSIQGHTCVAIAVRVLLPIGEGRRGSVSRANRRSVWRRTPRAGQASNSGLAPLTQIKSRCGDARQTVVNLLSVRREGKFVLIAVNHQGGNFDLRSVLD